MLNGRVGKPGSFHFAYMRGILTEGIKAAAGHLWNLKKEKENQMESYIF